MITVETNVKTVISDIIDFKLGKFQNISELNLKVYSEIILFPLKQNHINVYLHLITINRKRKLGEFKLDCHNFLNRKEAYLQ